MWGELGAGFTLVGILVPMVLLGIRGLCGKVAGICLDLGGLQEILIWSVGRIFK